LFGLQRLERRGQSFAVSRIGHLPRVPGISQFLDKAKHTYEQALSRFTESDYSGAEEFADASTSLSRVVEIVMARTLRSDTSLPSLVPPHRIIFAHPWNPDMSRKTWHKRNRFFLGFIGYWKMERSLLKIERKFANLPLWGDAFYKQAQHKYRDTVFEDAAEFAQAALAGAHSAEHVGRKWYVSHPIHS
jgi:hypothetical protein